MGEGGASAEFPDPDGNILREFLYPNGKWFEYYLLTANGLWIVIFFGLCIGMLMPCFTGFHKDRLRRNFDLFLCLVIFFSIFVILFTEGRSRYLLSFLPIFCIVSVNGYAYFGKLAKNLYRHKKASKIVLSED
jgi:CDP-diglyceride synthetase